MTQYSGKPSTSDLIPSLDNIYRAALDSVAPTLTVGLDLIDLFNQNRLFWVWGSGLLDTVLKAIPQDLFDGLINNGNQILSDLAPHTGMLSFILYYIRLLFNIIQVFALAREAYNNDLQKRDYFYHFLIQLDIRKFILINDIFWAPGNMVCFIWLTAKTGLGFWGDVFTAILLTIDTIIATLDYSEQEGQHKQLMLDYENKKANMDSQSIEYQTICAQQTQAKKDWENKQIDLIRSILYAAALLVAFSLIVAGSVFPPLSTAGTYICFILTISNNFTTSGLSIYNAYCAKEEAQMALANAPTDIQLQMQATYHNELLFIKTLQLFPVVIPQLLIPPLVFAAFMIGSGGTGFALVVSLLIITPLLAVAAAYILKLCEPEAPEPPKQTENTNRFFSTIPTPDVLQNEVQNQLV